MTPARTGLQRLIASRWLPLAVVGLAFALRVGFVLAHQRPLFSDERDYDQLGWTLAQTGHYSSETGPTAYRSVGYPAFVALIYSFAGRSPLAVKLVQAACDSATAFLLFLVLAPRGWRQSTGDRGSRLAAVTAAALWALFPPAILFSNAMLSECLAAFALVGLSYLVDRGFRFGAVVAGLLLGWVILMKPMMLLFAALLPVALHKVRPARFVLTLLIVAFLPVGLWIGRNWAVMHASLLTTSGGINLLIGNNPSATGGYQKLDSIRRRAGGAEREEEADAAARREAWNHIESHPGRALLTGIRKLVVLATSEGELVVGAFAANPGDQATRFREKYRSVPIWLHLMVSLPTAAILLLAAFGLATRRPDILDRSFYALFFAVAASCFVFFGGARFRFPMIPFLMLFGSEFIAGGWRRLASTKEVRIALALAAAGVVAVVWAAEFAVIYGVTEL